MKSEISFNAITSLLIETKKLPEHESKLMKKGTALILKKLRYTIFLSSILQSEENILKNISLKIDKNSSIGIVGKTGCGKSTFIKILAGLLTLTSGKVLVNDKDVKENIQGWYSNISYIPQSIHLTDDKYKNIALGEYENEIDNNKLLKSHTAFWTRKFIKNLPQGMETFGGANGLKLSGDKFKELE